LQKMGAIAGAANITRGSPVLTSLPEQGAKQSVDAGAPVSEPSTGDLDRPQRATQRWGRFLSRRISIANRRDC
jgi:hypothetical protein